MNPFNNTLDDALCGKYVEVANNEMLYRGWVDKIHHQRGSVVLHDAVRHVRPDYVEPDARPLSVYDEEAWQSVGSVFIRTAQSITSLDQTDTKEITVLDPAVTTPHPLYPDEIEVVEDHLWRAFRDGFTGGYPVVRSLSDSHAEYDMNDRFQILNGHKRIEAAKRAGVTRHPVEVLRCTDEQADELFMLAHPELVEETDT